MGNFLALLVPLIPFIIIAIFRPRLTLILSGIVIVISTMIIIWWFAANVPSNGWPVVARLVFSFYAIVGAINVSSNGWSVVGILVFSLYAIVGAIIVAIVAIVAIVTQESVGTRGTVIMVNSDRRYQVQVDNKIWDAVSSDKLAVGDKIEVISVNFFQKLLTVRKHVVTATVTGEFSGKYRVRVNNNICTAVSIDNLAIGDQVEVVSTDNEILIVKKISSQSPETPKEPVKIQISEKQAETILALPSAFPLFLKFIGATVGSFILMAFILAITLKVDILIHSLIYIGVILIISDIKMLQSKIISAIGAVFILWDIGRNTLPSWPNPSNIELIIFLILLGAVIITAFSFAFKRSKKVQDDKKQAIIKKSSQPQWTWLSAFPLFMQFIGATAGSFLLITVILAISSGGFTLTHSLIYMGAILIIFDMQMLQSRIISAIGAVFILWDIGRNTLPSWPNPSNIELIIFLILLGAVIITAFIFAFKRSKKVQDDKKQAIIKNSSQPQWRWLSGFPLFMQFIGATAGSFLLITVILAISSGGFTLTHSLIYIGAILIIFDMQMLQSRIISAIGAVFILWDTGSMLFGWQTSVTIENIFLILFIAVIATAFIFARKKTKKQNNLKENATILETTK